MGRSHQKKRRISQPSDCNRELEVQTLSDESDESEDDEVLVSEGEEQEEVDESAFEKLITSALEQSRYI